LFIAFIVLSGCLGPAEEIVSGSSDVPDSGINISLETVAEGFAAPVAFVSPLDGTGRMFVVDQAGTINVVMPDGSVTQTPFLDLRQQMVELDFPYDERGLLGLAFHPDFSENKRIFVYYSAPLRDGAPAGWDHTSRISEFRIKENNPHSVEPSSEKIIMEIDQPQSNHDGGQLTFGPDGYLYIPLGDGGGANDNGKGHYGMGNAQNTSNILGSIIRIDVDSGDPYSVPTGNPFVGLDGKDEIFAYGFRNPFHISFDSGGNHSLFAADAGQNRWEEVDIVEKGGNYGWNIREGSHCFDPENPNSEPSQCPDVGPEGASLVNPVIEYKNANAEEGVGYVVVGGTVYRGDNIPSLSGKYIFGDWSTSKGIGNGILFAAEETEDGWIMSQLHVDGREDGQVGSYLLGIGEDEEDELYVLVSDTLGPHGESGKIYRIDEVNE
jgi:glucose/arabinose dehydrogenase